MTTPVRPPKLMTVSDQRLSLWQSAVSDTVRENLRSTGDASQAAVLDHPMMRGANVHVDHANRGAELSRQSEVEAADPVMIHSALSALHFEIAQAQYDGDAARAEAAMVEIRRYSSKYLPGWASCVPAWIAYYGVPGRQPFYRDWKKEGHSDPNYGVIQWTIPADGKIGIIGDWGTGMDDAKAMLAHMIALPGISAVIHLGDIYYSGTDPECQATVSAIFDEVFEKAGFRVPVFMIPGNHDYYAGGAGFYQILDTINGLNPVTRQHASYFSLRSADGQWQFLAMDTGINDRKPLATLLHGGSPDLIDSEKEWHTHHLETFQGKTVLLSHHQLFSANSTLQNVVPQWLNPSLMKIFSPYFDRGVVAWLWGHEHNLVVYNDGQQGLLKGRLIGCSGYEERDNEDPYTIVWPQVTYLEPASMYQIGVKDNYYNHAFMVLDFGVRDEASDPIKATYYQYPSWGGVIDPAAWPQPDQVATEYLGEAATAHVDALYYSDQIQLVAPDGSRIGAFHAGLETAPGIEYFPQNFGIGGAAVDLALVGNVGMVHDGDAVSIQTKESLAGRFNLLGKFVGYHCYYFDAEFYTTNTQWRVRKVDTSKGTIVHDGDQVYFENQGNHQAILQPTPDHRYTAAPANPPTPWTIVRTRTAPVPSVPVRFGDRVKLLTFDGHGLCGAYSGRNYWFATIGPSVQAVTLILLGGPIGTPIGANAQFQIVTTEDQVGTSNVLGAWSDNWAEYRTPGDSLQNWSVTRSSRSGSAGITYGNPLDIFNQTGTLVPIADSDNNPAFPMYMGAEQTSLFSWQFVAAL